MTFQIQSDPPMAHNKKRGCSASPTDNAWNVRTKESAFAEHYDTANKTNEEVLSMHFLFDFVSNLNYSDWLAKFLFRGTNKEVDVIMLRAFQDTYFSQGEWGN